jgi:hypothetical protein
MRVYPKYLLISLFSFIILVSCINKEFPVKQYYQETQYNTETIIETYTDNITSAIIGETGEYELPAYYYWSSSNLSFKEIANLHYWGYEIPQTPYYENIRLRITIWQQLQRETAIMSIFDVTKSGQIPSPDPSNTETPSQPPTWYAINGISSDVWLKSANSAINNARFLGGSNFNWAKPSESREIELEAGKARSIAIIIAGPQNTWNSRFNVHVKWSRNNVSIQPVTKERLITRQIPYQLQKEKTTYEIKSVPFWDFFLSK